MLPTFLWVSKFDFKLGVGVKILKITRGRWFFYFWLKTCISLCFLWGFKIWCSKVPNLSLFLFFLYHSLFPTIFSKLPYVRLFLKNHAKCIGMGWGIREVTASINFRSIPTMSLRGPVNTPTDERRRREFDGTDGWDGWTVTKSDLQFSSYFVGI